MRAWSPGIDALGVLASGTVEHEPATPDAAFWCWLSREAPALSKDSLESVVKRVQRELDKAHHGILVEAGGDGAHRVLVFTADGDRRLFPAVQELFATDAAPPSAHSLDELPREVGSLP